jgi:SAM-dependent methyltransferase
MQRPTDSADTNSPGVSERAREPGGVSLPYQPRHGSEFDAFYAGTPAWDIGRPQPAFMALADSGGLMGRVLDVGCGTGEHALLAASLGLAATGIDASQTAIGHAERKARERNVEARFLIWDALDLPALEKQFDTVLDSGLFHVFDDDDRARYVDSLRAVVAPGGRYYMLCFSDMQPGDFGPRRVSQAEIHASFADRWRIESLERTIMDLTIRPEGAHAWLATIVRA